MRAYGEHYLISKGFCLIYLYLNVRTGDASSLFRCFNLNYNKDPQDYKKINQNINPANKLNYNNIKNIDDSEMENNEINQSNINLNSASKNNISRNPNNNLYTESGGMNNILGDKLSDYEKERMKFFNQNNLNTNNINNPENLNNNEYRSNSHVKMILFKFFLAKIQQKYFPQ